MRSTAARRGRRRSSTIAARTAAHRSISAGSRTTASAASTTAGNSTAPAKASSRRRSEPPPFPHFPHRTTEGLIQVWNVERVPCNYLQSFENSMDEVHVAFTHQPGGSHAKLAADLPVITAEETDWGMLRFGTRKSGKV